MTGLLLKPLSLFLLLATGATAVQQAWDAKGREESDAMGRGVKLLMRRMESLGKHIEASNDDTLQVSSSNGSLMRRVKKHEKRVAASIDVEVQVQAESSNHDLHLVSEKARQLFERKSINLLDNPEVIPRSRTSVLRHDRKTCFSSRVDVRLYRYGTRLRDGDVCKRHVPELRKRWGKPIVYLGYASGTRTLCMLTHGDERSKATVEMIQDAIKLLDDDCKELQSFGNKTIFTADMDQSCSFDMAYSADMWLKGCKTKLIPDFSFYQWKSAGLLPNYTSLTSQLEELGSHPATEQRCGWAGALSSNGVRAKFKKVVDSTANNSLFDVVIPSLEDGPGGQGTHQHWWKSRISMEDQVRRWSCLVDLPARGYSGRVPYLLHSGRPVLMVERAVGLSMAATWYSHLLEPWVHYIPASHDLTDLTSKAKFALGLTPNSNATEIAANALELAQRYLTYEVAIKNLRDTLVEVSHTP